MDDVVEDSTRHEGHSLDNKLAIFQLESVPLLFVRKVFYNIIINPLHKILFKSNQRIQTANFNDKTILMKRKSIIFLKH